MRDPIDMGPTPRNEGTARQGSTPLQLTESPSHATNPVVTLVTAGNPERLTGCNLYYRHILESLEAIGIPSTKISIPERPYPWKLLALRPALRRQKPSVVVMDSRALWATVSLIPWVREQLGASLIVLMPRLPSELAPAWRRPLTRNLECRLLRSADGVVAGSPFLRSLLIASGAAADKTVVIPAGRDGIPSAGRPPNGHLKERFRFLCVANWSESKGIHLLIEAMDKLSPRVHLDLVGDGEHRRYARHIFDLLRRSSAASRVHIHGPLEGEALARRYLAADVFALPSISEGFGTVYAEAMSFGLPVIASRVGPLPWLVEHGCGVLIPPNDVAALVEAMQTLSTHPAVPRRMAEAALHRALRLPTWQDSEKRFLSLVDGLLR